MASDHVDMLTAELRAHGVARWVVETTSGNHRRLRFRFNDRDVVLVFPASPSDRFGAIKAVQDLRKAMGVSRIITKNPDRRAATPDRCKAPPPPTLTFTTKPNPWHALEALKRP